MTHLDYRPKGTCSTLISIDAEDGVIRHIEFKGGCRGNLQGVSRLAEGRPIQDVIAICQGILCRNGTSCPDQLSKALTQMLEEKA